MLLISLWLNILVLVPVCLSLLLDRPQMAAVYGPRTQARSILVALYLALLAASGALLIYPDTHASKALLGIQVFYKLLTPITVGDASNQVVLSNVAIALFHAATLLSI
jgi:hypothetical protein